ncbi:MAG: hypothetical protein JRH11_09695 [Deltaproteobacteria bacterium]|nr:hypothetical protein [Deltaproteobacteria bacterium]
MSRPSSFVASGLGAGLVLGILGILTFPALTACGGAIEVTDEPLPGVGGTADTPQDQVIPLAANAGTTPDCVTVTGRAIYGALAYNHWVYVANDCDRTVNCTVGTDVSAETASVEVGPGERSETSTYLGSPASQFTPRVDCE